MTLVDALTRWIGHQRWFAGKGAAPALNVVASLEWDSSPEARIVTHLVRDAGGERDVLYQIPVTYRREPVDRLSGALIGVVDDAAHPWHAYDAPHDPVFAQRLIRLIVDGDGIGTAGGASARGAPAVARTVPADVTASRVMDGEQSNTSIVCTLAGGDTERGGEAAQRIICKLFRTLHHGENPDVVLQSALSTGGSPYVPRSIGWVVGEWPDPARPTGLAQGHLAFAQEFLSGAEDAWHLALAAAAVGADFTSSARRMGAATADVQLTLAAALPTRDATASDIEAVCAGWRERMNAAIRQVPDLAALRKPIEELYAAARSASWPRLQRIHGDLHLGQILATPQHGWAIIDFEGEPLRPLAERALPDVPLRDVAGMLRSFDYVAGSLPDAPGVREWADACRGAFVEGYVERAHVDQGRHGALLDAFEVDKALYEAVYEARNRPGWLPIPVEAIRRLVAPIDTAPADTPPAPAGTLSRPSSISRYSSAMRAFNREFIDAATQTAQLVTVGGNLYTFEHTPVQSTIWYPDLRVKRNRVPWGWVVDEGDGTYSIHVAVQPGDAPSKVGRGDTVEQAILNAL